MGINTYYRCKHSFSVLFFSQTYTSSNRMEGCLFLTVLPAFLIVPFLLTHVYLQVGFLAGVVIVFKFVYWNKALKAFSS